MKNFTISQMLNSTVLYVYADREAIQLDPTYQRDSEIWTLDKRQLLIDSIINGFDIPKLYLHEFPKPKKVGAKTYSFAVVDGKQRLESIWKFIGDEYPLALDFEFYRDDAIKPAGLKYSELGKQYPNLKLKLDAFPLPIMLIRTDGVDENDVIDDLFLRLNEAVALNAPEKRNAFGGPMVPTLKAFAAHKFFKNNLVIRSTRGRHLDLAAKFFVIEEAKGPVELKKKRLDAFVRGFKGKTKNQANEVAKKSKEVLDQMVSIFHGKDKLLKSVGMVTLYYLLIRDAQSQGYTVKREHLEEFERVRKANRDLAEKSPDDENINADHLEFDRFAQSPNDLIALKFRLAQTQKFLQDRHRAKLEVLTIAPEQKPA